jgi:hypothetical protein
MKATPSVGDTAEPDETVGIDVAPATVGGQSHDFPQRRFWLALTWVAIHHAVTTAPTRIKLN